MGSRSKTAFRAAHGSSPLSLADSIKHIRLDSEQAGTYGTRCSTVVPMEQLGTRRQVRVVERSFDESGAIHAQQEQRLDLIAPSVGSRARLSRRVDKVG